MAVLDKVYDALVEAGLNVSYARPAAFREIPAVTLKETVNRCAVRADGEPYLTELEYTVDGYDRLLSEALELGETIDEALTALNLTKRAFELTHEEDTGLARVRTRYGGYADGDGVIYTHL